MIVDPSTGMPVALSSTAQNYDPSALSGALGIDVAQGYGVQNSTVLSMMEHIPSAWATSGWNMGRGSNTILNGGYSKVGPRGGGFRQGIGGNPRSWMRFSDASNIDPYPIARRTFNGQAFGPSGKQIYSPFNMLARSGNWMGNKMVSAAFERGVGSKILARAANAGIVDPNLLNMGHNQEFFSRGMMSRISAASRVSGTVPSASRVANIGNFLSKTNRGLYNAAIETGALGPGMSGRTASELTIGSARGPVSQYVGGYIQGSKFGKMTNEGFGAYKRAGQEAMISAGNRAIAHLGGIGLEHTAQGGLRVAANATGKMAAHAGERVGARLAAKAVTSAGVKAGAKGGMALLASTLAIPGVNIATSAIMAAWMAYDVASMGISAMTGAADFARDAGKSLKGSIDKPVMGMGYQDTTVAATSRARGVQAIASSRLNARSVLGSEGAVLAAHFG